MRKFFMSALAVVALAITVTVQTVAQESFAYQAVIRDSEGTLITEKEVGLQFSLMQGGQTYYVETQKTKTNQYGNITVEIGKGEKKSGSFADVPWHTLDVTLKVEVDPAGGNKYITLGETKISPAPYAMYASKSGGVAKPNAAAKGSETLFEVNDRNGNPVFAVTDEGVVVYVDDTDAGKVRRSGFLIVGRNATKEDPEPEYFSVTTDGTQIFVNSEDSKVRRSGFLIVGRNASKDDDDNQKYMTVDEEGTHVYVDAADDEKVRRSGFLIVGRNATKDSYNDVLKIDGNQTTVFVDGQDNSKVRRSGFLIVGRNATKDDQNTYLTVTTDNTELNTKSLAVTAPGDSVIPIQMENGLLYFRGDIALDGELRRWIDLEETEKFSFYMSDTANTDDFSYDSFDYSVVEDYTGYELEAFAEAEIGYSYYYDLDDIGYYDDNDNWHGHDYDYSRLATINEKGQLMPCLPDGIILFDINGNETRTLTDAVVMLKLDYSWKLYLWPLTALTDFNMSFALINEDWNGNATKYERYDFVVNSRQAYAGSYFSPVAQRKYDSNIGYYYDKYTVKITSGDDEYEYEVIDNYADDAVSAVFGSTVTLEALAAPEGMVFDYWLKKENTYDDYGVPYFGNPLEVTISNVNKVYFEAHFKEIPPILVDGQNGDDETGDGDKKPFKTLERALRYIADENNSTGTHKIKLSNWLDDISVGSEVNDKSAGITIDLVENNSIDGSSDAEHSIDISTTVPVTISNMNHFARLSTDRIVNVAKNASLTLKSCLVCGREYDDGSITDNANVGAAYVAGTLALDNSHIRYFSADNGGGVYIANGGSLYLSKSSIENCSADNGGGVYVATGGNIEIDDISSISNNGANENGGGLYFATVNGNSQITISGITENTANNGGGVYLAGGTLIINNNVNISGNSATNGGGVYVKAGTLKLGNGSIENNDNSNYTDETTYGGGVYVNTNASFEMNGGSIYDNKATNGGGVYLKAKTQNNSTISTFTMNGGSIYSNNFNSANTKGDGVYVSNGSVFNISGYAQLYRNGSYNNVYLASGTTINVSDDLSYNNVARIVPQTYQANTPVVTSGNINDFSKFVVEKQTIINTFGAKIDIEWTIDENGQLQKAATSGGNSIAGALDGKFKVSDKKTIQFSKGNLEYLASTGEWRFAEDQIDKGDWTANTTNFSATNDGWINRFGYGTSGWNSGAQQYQPYSSDNDASKYLQTSMTGSNANADWGVYNAISNGGNTHGKWRTLTADEWNYLFNGRGTTSESQKKFGKVRINLDGGGYIVGVIILPDDWTMTTDDFAAAGITFKPGANPSGGSQYVVYDANTLNETQWKLMEDNGAVLLPALGYRKVNVVYDGETGEIVSSEIKIEDGNYWENYNGSNEPPIGYYWNANGSFVKFEKNSLQTNVEWNRCYGMCVRLVVDVVDKGSDKDDMAVDLGLPSGKKWAKINLGYTGSTSDVYQVQSSFNNATVGGKYAWGETESKGTFSWSNYKYKGETSGTYSKYNDADGLDVLELEDDPAYAEWGGNWRTPTDEDWKELWENCYWVAANYTNSNTGNNYVFKIYRVKEQIGGAGEHFNAINNNSTPKYIGWAPIAIPVNSQTGVDRQYWSSVKNNYGVQVFNTTYVADIWSNYLTSSGMNRYDGKYIRPVWVPITTTVFYVSTDGNDTDNDGTRNAPFATIQQAANKMIDSYTRYTIFIDGELSGDQELSGTIKARSITLRGANGLDNSTGQPKDMINSSISVSTTVPLTVENLEITGGVTVGSNAKVTLTGGALVNNVSVGGTFTMKNDAKVTSEIVTSEAANVTLTGNATVAKATIGGTSTFTMNDDAVANEVVLGSGRTITVGSLNTEGSAITVKLASNDDYTEGRQVLIKSGIDNLPLNRFSLTQPDGAATPWIINSDGALHKLIGAIAPGEYLYIGYVVFPDGSASLYSDLTDEQKAQAVAVVFDNHDSENYYLAVSLEETQSKWATQESAMYNNYDDLHQYCGAVYDGSQNDLSGCADYSEEKYPAMWWAWHYSYNGVNEGWYLPAEQELSYLFQSFNYVNNALSALGKTPLSDGDDGYWTSTMSSTNYIKFFNKANVDEGYVTGSGAYMHEKTKGVRPIRRY